MPGALQLCRFFSFIIRFRAAGFERESNYDLKHGGQRLQIAFRRTWRSLPLAESFHFSHLANVSGDLAVVRTALSQP